MDEVIRHSAFMAIRALWAQWGDAIPWKAITVGFKHEGVRIPLISPAEGVFKPAGLNRGVLSLRSTLSSRYSDERLSDDRIWYDYSPREHRNDSIRANIENRIPVLYFLQIKEKPGVEYLVFAPVDVLEDDRSRRRFLLDLSPTALYSSSGIDTEIRETPERRYGVSQTRVRIFQAHFRKTVLEAYSSSCALCRLGERTLLDGAHLVPDREELGEPHITNGIALCAVHHRAFDAHFFGIRPDYRIEVFRERLAHPDAKATRILTDYDGREINKPRRDQDKPDKSLLEWRWERSLAG